MPVRARKRFGQHFLHDPAVLERIVRAVAPAPGERLLEIGPGRGALTQRLLQTPLSSLDAVEIDRDLAAQLRVRFAADTRFALHETDALRFEVPALARARGGALRVVGNLPYNISTPLLFHLLQSVDALTDMHLMLQREVVARITAQPGSSEYGRLTVMLAPWVRAQWLFDVGPGAFQPAPRVWSSVVRLVVLAEPAFPIDARYGVVVAAAFAHRRKTLRNALRGVRSAAQIEACGLDPQVRPEMLPASAFQALACAAESAAAPSLSDTAIG